MGVHGQKEYREKLLPMPGAMPSCPSCLDETVATVASAVIDMCIFCSDNQDVKWVRLVGQVSLLRGCLNARETTGRWRRVVVRTP